MKLLNSSKNLILVNNLEKAESLYSRLKGLLGRPSLSSDSALWIDQCTSIHTFFMQFSIDVVFIDHSFKVKKIANDVRPWRVVGPVWGAKSVIEFAKGTVAQRQVEVGDQLNVVD